MTPNPTLKGIKKLLAKAELEKALESFMIWTVEHHSEYEDEVAGHSSTFYKIENDNREGILTEDEYKARTAKLNKALFSLLSLCENEKDNPPTLSTAVLGSHHQYTCNRVSQVSSFKKFRSIASENKLHFFYLYGGDRHSHEGCIMNIACQLDNRARDYSPSVSITRKSEKTVVINCPFETNEDLGLDQEDLIKNLYSAFDLTPSEYEPLLENNLSNILDHSPRVSGLKRHHNICVRISISEFDWDEEMTPELVQWFIESFCKLESKENRPSVFFFFAIEYDDDNPIEEEISKVILAASYVKMLPKLDMVSYKHITQWFSKKYKAIEAHSGARQKKMEETFGTAEDFFMEDVQLKLKKIIDEVKNKKHND